MDPILGLLFFLAVGYSLKHAAQHAGAVRRGSPQHPVSWWAREASRGFPLHRTGFHAGWLAHKTALDHRRARREEARTTHLETRASILSEIREHRRRQAEAQALIDRAGQPLLDEVAQRRAAAKKKMRAADEALQENSEAERKAGIREETPRFHELNDAFWEARQEYQDAKRRPLAAAPSRRVDGEPETEADKKFFDLRESGYTGPIDQDGNIPDPSDPANARPLELLEAMQSQTEGVPVSADVNYTQTLEETDRLKGEVEQALGEIKWEEMGSTVDQLGAMLAGDRDTLASAAEVADELRQAKKQLEQTLDSVTEMRNTLVRNHGGIKEAVDDSPVEQPAEPEFYTD